MDLLFLYFYYPLIRDMKMQEKHGDTLLLHNLSYQIYSILRRGTPK